MSVIHNLYLFLVVKQYLNKLLSHACQMGLAAMVFCPPPRQCRYVYLRRCVIVILSQER